MCTGYMAFRWRIDSNLPQKYNILEHKDQDKENTNNRRKKFLKHPIPWQLLGSLCKCLQNLSVKYREKTNQNQISFEGPIFPDIHTFSLIRNKKFNNQKEMYKKKFMTPDGHNLHEIKITKVFREEAGTPNRSEVCRKYVFFQTSLHFSYSNFKPNWKRKTSQYDYLNHAKFN